MTRRVRLPSRAQRGIRASFAVVLAITVVACEREERRFRELPPSASAVNAVPVTDLQPGGTVVAESTLTRYDNNAYALSQGKRLYESMNCAGCHSHGGGGMGPALMDDEWIYGSDPAQIFKTIVEGRPNGMPSWKGKLGTSQTWQLVAYIRSMSGLGSRPASSSRDDHMKTSPNLQMRKAEKPKNSVVPPGAVMP
ncbi:MAG TPA: c-type cytochrome [Gemmatimonadaceae bacterium]|nr:c-type cytochrome [Gemmatimonadaceae bacterium]